ncbi:hypothetical protein BKA80DRAFT_270726 [Phyllosticta citrichinensis]
MKRTVASCLSASHVADLTAIVVLADILCRSVWWLASMLLAGSVVVLSSLVVVAFPSTFYSFFRSAYPCWLLAPLMLLHTCTLSLLIPRHNWRRIPNHIAFCRFLNPPVVVLVVSSIPIDPNPPSKCGRKRGPKFSFSLLLCRCRSVERVGVRFTQFPPFVLRAALSQIDRECLP